MTVKSRLIAVFDEYNTLLFLIIPLILIAVVANRYGTNVQQRIVLNMFINLILVLGLQVFMGNGGILNFSHIGFMGIGAYASVICSMTPQAKSFGIPDLYEVLKPVHLPFWLSLLVGGGVAALLAAILSFPLMRLSDASAVITSFALLVIIYVVLVHWSNITNGPQTLFGVNRYTDLRTSVGWGLLFVALAYWFKESSFGLRLRATRDDEYAAATSGINMVIMRWIAFTLSAFMAGIAGGLWAHFITSFSPKSFYLTETFVILAMLVVGGPGGVSGAVVGTLTVTAVREGLRQIENEMTIQQTLPISLIGFTEVSLAIALILILVLRPGGIMGGREIRWVRKRGAPIPADPTPTAPIPEVKGA
jgi:branched-chain amino acid transport system permease protein